jgi:endonuclease/exonuclease/phosphatase family metal-dependent hydrolase
VEVRALVYNLRQLRDDENAAARVIRDARPDVALLQECGTRRRLHRLAGAVDMAPVHGALYPFVRLVRNAVLLRSPWRSLSHRVHRFHRSQRFYPRGALVGDAGRSGVRVWLLSVHLGLAGEERQRHSRELTDLAGSLRGPVLIGGDLNEDPGRPAARWLADRYVDAWAAAGSDDGNTFPSAEPTSRIDYLFAGEGIEVLRATVPDGPDVRRASDHRPVLVDLRLPE